ncbi:MAG: hypothetical protein WA821_20910 [Anaerolineales bacterium]
MLSKFRINALLLSFLGLGFIFLFSMPLVAPKNIDGAVQNFLWSAGFFCWGFVGIVMMIGKDVIRLRYFGRNPRAAVIFGLLWMLLSFSLALLPLLPIIRK